jgi:hypothetical protein
MELVLIVPLLVAVAELAPRFSASRRVPLPAFVLWRADQLGNERALIDASIDAFVSGLEA